MTVDHGWLNKQRGAFFRRSFLIGVMGLTAVSVLGACEAMPIPPPVPENPGFDEARANELVRRGHQLSAGGDFVAAATAFRDAAKLWPISEPAWGGLADAARSSGNDGEARLAVFLGSRVGEYARMHPRQARTAFLGASMKPPPEPPGLQLWAERLVTFFEYQDALGIRRDYDVLNPGRSVRR